MKPNQTRMTACRQNPLCNKGRTWRSVSLAPEFLHRFFRLSCLGSAFNFNASLEMRMCVWLRSFTGPQDRVLTCLSQYQKRTWFHQEEERAPELFKYHSIHKAAQISAQSIWSPHLNPHPPSLCGLAAYRQSLACGMIALLIWSFQGNYPDISLNTLTSMMSTQHRVHFHLNV